MTTTIKGQLEIDHDRGVIYFHTLDTEMIEQRGTVSILRICSLPAIPYPLAHQLDITHNRQVNWQHSAQPKSHKK